MNRLNKLFMAGTAFFGATATLFAGDEASAAGAAVAGAGIGATLLYIAVLLAVIIGLWKVFTKAGKPGWAILIPIYNTIVMLEIAGRPIWWIILLFIPFANIVVSIIVSIDIAKAFGKGIGFGLGLAFFPFIFYPILGYGSSQYTEQQAIA
jgi:Family of unknown function (DUF5684)